MKKGAEGNNVILLQARLRWLGYEVGTIDGSFGEKTDQAVRAFQEDQKLTIDGIVGRFTGDSIYVRTKNAWLFYFIHCSATKEGDDKRGAWVKWLHQTKKGWSRPGYPDVICLDGQVESLRPFNTDNLVTEDEYTFGVKGSTLLNRNSIHLCYIGGLDKTGKKAKDTRTEGQRRSMRILVESALLRNPKLIIAGHNDVQYKECPCFSVAEYLRSLEVPESNIVQWPKKFRVR